MKKKKKKKKKTAIGYLVEIIFQQIPLGQSFWIHSLFYDV